MDINYTNSSLGTQNVIFLNKALEVLPQNNLIPSIRSHMYHVARELPCNKFDEIVRYRRCGTCGFELKKLTNVFKLEPAKKVSRALRRLKLKESLNTKYQRLSRKKFDKRKEMQQILALKCDMCNTIVKQNIRKPYLEKLRKKEQPALVAVTPSNKKAKTKKKKDRYSGLNKLLVNNAKCALENNNIIEDPEKLKIQLETINLMTADTIYISDSLQKTPPLAADNNNTSKNAPITNISDMLTPVYLSNKKSRKRKSTITNIIEKPTEIEETVLTPQNKSLKTVTQVVNTRNQKHVENTLKTPKLKTVNEWKTPKNALHSSKKMKKNKNIILVSEKNEKEKKQKKLNTLSNLLQKQIGNLKSTTSGLQDFLNNVQ